MAIGNIFNIPVKTEISTSLQGLSIAVAGESKAGKSTFCSQASRPAFLQTELGTRNLTGITPLETPTFNDFKSAVNQLCTPKGREAFDTVVIDSMTNLLLIVDRAYAAKASEGLKDDSGHPLVLESASDAPFGKGTKLVKNAIATQLQKLTNAGFLVLTILHLEEKTDFDSGKKYIGPTISPGLNNLIERFVDQTIYLTGKAGKNHNLHFTPAGGYANAGGRFTMLKDTIPTDFATFEKVFKEGIVAGADKKAATVVEEERISVLESPEYDYIALKEELPILLQQIMDLDQNNGAKIQAIVASEIGSGQKATEIKIEHVENLYNIIASLKREFKIGE